MTGNKTKYRDDDEILVEEFEKDPTGWVSAPESEKQEAIEAAKAYRAKRETRVSIRISKELLSRLKEQAEVEGLGYQTYISSKLYKVAFGDPTEKRLARLEEEVFAKTTGK